MRDVVSKLKVELLHPAIRDEVKTLIEQAEDVMGEKIAIRVAQGLRTIEEQDAVYALGRTVKNTIGVTKKRPFGSTVSRAPGGYSYHNYGLAIDFCLLYDKDGNGTWETLSWKEAEDFNGNIIADWKEVVKVFTYAGYEWGGAWSTIHDAPHLQKRFGHLQNASDLFKKYKAKDFIGGTKYVNI